MCFIGARKVGRRPMHSRPAPDAGAKVIVCTRPNAVCSKNNIRPLGTSGVTLDGVPRPVRDSGMPQRPDASGGCVSRCRASKHLERESGLACLTRQNAGLLGEKPARKHVVCRPIH